MDGWMSQFNITFAQTGAKQTSGGHSNERKAIELYLNLKYSSGIKKSV